MIKGAKGFFIKVLMTPLWHYGWYFEVLKTDWLADRLSEHGLLLLELLSRLTEIYYNWLNKDAERVLNLVTNYRSTLSDGPNRAECQSLLCPRSCRGQLHRLASWRPADESLLLCRRRLGLRSKHRVHWRLQSEFLINALTVLRVMLLIVIDHYTSLLYSSCYYHLLLDVLPQTKWTIMFVRKRKDPLSLSYHSIFSHNPLSQSLRILSHNPIPQSPLLQSWLGILTRNPLSQFTLCILSLSQS